VQGTQMTCAVALSDCFDPALVVADQHLCVYNAATSSHGAHFGASPFVY